jgi:hypothetical protein
MSETPTTTTNTTPPVANSATNPTSRVAGLLNSWKVKAGLIGTVVVSALVGIFLLFFFWAHIVAEMGVRSWSSHAGASPIECMIKDTNSDGYVSCSAMLKGEVVPLECGSSIFNIGCRVNYGSAVAPLRQNQPNITGR